ncbi:hypothetical protein QR680_004370 [Steinernema hermaphroditum]|uniref:Autophagy-related protein 2 n=1 Tax=Steinernema hermaphroditum TaxID=289476 RepID=A0AA39HNH0_9BILA|nr:hypothetical protein QR680_004370 [Steinernema hermaphroditum]
MYLLLPLLLGVTHTASGKFSNNVNECNISLFRDSYFAVPNLGDFGIALIDGHQKSLTDLDEKFNDLSVPNPEKTSLDNMRLFYTANYSHILVTARNVPSNKLQIGVVAVEDLISGKAKKFSVIGEVDANKICRPESTFYDMKKEAIGFDGMTKGRVRILKKDDGQYTTQIDGKFQLDSDYCGSNKGKKALERVTDFFGNVHAKGLPFHEEQTDLNVFVNQLESEKFLLMGSCTGDNCDLELVSLDKAEEHVQIPVYNSTCHIRDLSATELSHRVLLIPKNNRHLGVNLTGRIQNSTTSSGSVPLTSVLLLIPKTMAYFATNLVESAGIFLINRYMGELFTKKIKLGDLKVDFTSHFVTLSDLELNIQYINENLEKLGINLEVVEGHVEELSLAVPFMQFQEKPIDATIDGLLLCVRPRRGGPIGEINDIIYSMIGSMMTSTELAKEYFAVAPEQQKNEGVEACKDLLAGLTTRIVLKAKNVVLRMENQSEESEFVTAVECHLDSITFVDDQLEACEKESYTLSSTKTDSKTVFSLTTLNKTLHLSGIRFYTDICSKPEQSSSVLTSLYQRQNRLKSEESDGPSCDEIPSDPIQFGQIAGDDNVVKISISANDENSPKKVKLDINLQSLQLFINPSQIQIINEVMDSLLAPKTVVESGSMPHGGRPMNSLDFRKVELQMKNAHTSQGSITEGNWAGQCHLSDDFEFVNLEQNHSQLEESVSSNDSETTLYDDSDTTRFSAVIGSVMMILAYDDPWTLEKTKNVKLQDVLQKSRDLSEKVFTFASAIRTKGVNLRDVRTQISALFPQDHILFAGWPLNLDLILTSERTDFHLSAAQIDCCEFLTADSINASEKSEHFDIFSFDGISENGSANFSLKMEITPKDKKDTITLTLGDCRTEFDPSIIDRLTDLIASEPFFKKGTPSSDLDLKEDPFSSVLGETESQPMLIDFDLRTSSWTIDFKIPKADLTEERLSYRVKNVNNESLKLHFDDVHLKMPKLDLSKVDLFWQIKLTCSSLTGTFSGDPTLLDCSEEELRFLYATRDRTIRENEDVCLELKYDKRNRSLTTGNAFAGDRMAKSVWGSFFEATECKEGPFSQKVVMRDNEEITMVGDRDELMDFGDSCRETSNLLVNINVPVLNVLLPSHMFYEVLYNRILNDLLLWQPSSPPFQNDSSHSATAPQHHFERFVDDSDSESEDEDSFEEVPGSSEKNHDVSITFDVDRFSLLLGTSKAQLRSRLEKTQLFVVSGYRGDPNLTYLYISSGSVGIYHQNLNDGVIPYESRVYSSKFAAGTTTEQICVEPLNEDCPLIHFLNDHRFALSMKIQNEAVNGLITKQDLLITTSLQNSDAHVNLFKDPAEFWVNQVTEFFNARDYGVPGYILPEYGFQVRFGVRSSLLSYDHAQVNEESNMRLKLAIGSCDFSCQIVEQQKRTNLQCILENTELLASNKGSPRQSSVKDTQFDQFVELLSLGYFEFNLNLEETDGIPIVHVKCKNDEIKAYFCSDSLSMLVNMFGDIASSDFLGALQGGDSDSEEKDSEQAIEDDGDGQSELDTSSDCDEFRPLDELPGLAILRLSGQPYMRSLAHLNENHTQGRSSIRQERCYKASPPQVASLVPGSEPAISIDIKDVTLRLFLFGGNDFGDQEGEVKSYSSEVQRRRARGDVRGGRHRDETVKLEFLFQKMSCRFEQYGPDGDTSYALLLSLHNMEIVDHLAVSEIKKMLYRDEMSDCYTRSQVPMLAFRMLANQHQGAKILVSALPVRMNIDQDSLEFLIDFFSDASNSISLPGEEIDIESRGKGETPPSKGSGDPVDYSYLFDEDKVNGDKSADWDIGGAEESESSNEDRAETNLDQCVSVDNIREFTFSPAVTIKIDYVGKRVKTDRGGALVGLLIGMSNLHSAEIKLKELHTTTGVFSFDRCLQYAVGEWLTDIRNNQLTKICGSYGPLSSLTQLAGGMCDLIALPFEELGKSDGHIVKGIQRGAGSFGLSTLATVVDFTQGIASTVKDLSEIAHYTINPDYRTPKQQSRFKRPGDLRAGLSMAMDTVRDGAYDAVDGLHMAVYDTDDYIGFRRVRRLASSVIVRPVVCASQAAVQLLGGLRNQLKPDQHKADMSKWRN